MEDVTQKIVKTAKEKIQEKLEKKKELDRQIKEIEKKELNKKLRKITKEIKIKDYTDEQIQQLIELIQTFNNDIKK